MYGFLVFEYLLGIRNPIQQVHESSVLTVGTAMLINRAVLYRVLCNLHRLQYGVRTFFVFVNGQRRMHRRRNIAHASSAVRLLTLRQPLGPWPFDAKPYSQYHTCCDTQLTQRTHSGLRWPFRRFMLLRLCIRRSQNDKKVRTL